MSNHDAEYGFPVESAHAADAEVPIPAGALSDQPFVRVDTWLWATRQVKSRSAATAAALRRSRESQRGGSESRAESQSRR